MKDDKQTVGKMRRGGRDEAEEVRPLAVGRNELPRPKISRTDIKPWETSQGFFMIGSEFGVRAWQRIRHRASQAATSDWNRP